MQLLPPVCELLRNQGAGDILVIAGGVIPKEDIPYLRQAGVAEVFTPGTPTGEIIEFVKESLA